MAMRKAVLPKSVPMLAAVLAFATPGSTVLAAPGDDLCKRDLFMADATISGSYRSLEMGGAKPEEQCAAWRRHVEALRKASATYGRCAVGPAKAAKTGELNGSIGDFQRLI